MTWKQDGQNWLIRLQQGELLVTELTQLVKDQGIEGAWISGLGAAQWTELGYYNLTRKEYNWHRIDELLEITSLQGNVAWQDGQPVLHLHGTFSDQKLVALGGHVKELQVGGTVELFLHRWQGGRLERQVDDQVGLALLDV